jgi:hypothetical protein
MTPEELLDELEKKYGSYPDDLEMINNERKSLGYLKRREKDPNYKGKTAMQSVLELKYILEWDGWKIAKKRLLPLFFLILIVVAVPAV